MVIDRLPGLFGQFEPDGMSGFPLTDGGTINGDPVRGYILDLRLTTSQPLSLLSMARLNIACSTFDLQLGPDRPDVFGPQRRFSSEQFALVPRGAARPFMR